MGDSRRAEIFARWISRNFPHVKSILCVADGRGELARRLANKKYLVRVIEYRPRFEGRAHKRIQYQKGWFSEDTEIHEDLVVGMHPDEATAPIILAAKKSKKPWAVVPCCIKGPCSDGVGSFKGWVARLKSLDYPVHDTMLKMNGKNTVLYCKR